MFFLFYHKNQSFAIHLRKISLFQRVAAFFLFVLLKFAIDKELEISYNIVYIAYFRIFYSALAQKGRNI
jgi:hypothetical protein